MGAGIGPENVAGVEISVQPDGRISDCRKALMDFGQQFFRQFTVLSTHFSR